MKAVLSLVILLSSVPALAQPADKDAPPQVMLIHDGATIEDGGTILKLRGPHYLMGRESVIKIMEAATEASLLWPEYEKCMTAVEELKEKQKPSSPWSALKWGALGAGIVGAFALGLVIAN